MSVLNQSGEEQVECPLCMEPLEVDDLNFYPCTCGYQICRFCWHRIRTDENGLCPACRKAYSENPADFTPLSKEQVAQLKAEKRQRDQQRKAKQTESRKHLASVRVVQRNLVFVVGLPMRLADPEILKRHEYFGKFGKIHKVVINQSTAYAGSQGPSASAYVTYMKNDDALRAIQSVNNIPLDGRHIKSSLGTTKYCSHFMKNQPCPKPDCMYLHDFGDPEASFTKEQMHAGKHQEYEKKLHEALLSRTAQSKAEQNDKRAGGEGKGANGKEPSANGGGSVGTTNNVPTSQTNGTTNTPANGNSSNGNGGSGGQNGTVKEGWPQLSADKKEGGGEKRDTKGTIDNKKVCNASNGSNNNNRNSKVNKKEKTKPPSPTTAQRQPVVVTQTDKESPTAAVTVAAANETEREPSADPEPVVTGKPAAPPLLDDNSSFFSHQNSYQKLLVPERAPSEDSETAPFPATQILNDSFPDISSAEDWEAAFGFTKHSNHLEELARQKHSSYYYGSSPDAFDLKRGINGTSDHMSKFFGDFAKSPKEMNGYYQPATAAHNGVNGHGGSSSSLVDAHIRFVQQQQQQRRHIEDQLQLLSLKQQSLQFMHNANQYMNGDGQRFCAYQNQFNAVNRPVTAPSGIGKQQQQQSLRSEDDLDFDPFQETQKGLAELIENDQSLKLHLAANSNGPSNQMNGLLHSQGGNGMLPPPPPGFVQPHMNSFGSKILPYLNMNSQQQLNTTQNNWPSSYNNVLHQQHKGMGACNDWKVLDPAIVSSSRYFSLATVPPLRGAEYMGQTHAQQQNGPARPSAAFEFGGAATAPSAYPALGQMAQQQQAAQQGYGFAQQNLHWLGADLGSQISTPPGFRSQGQATKQQQEC